MQEEVGLNLEEKREYAVFRKITLFISSNEDITRKILKLVLHDHSSNE